MDSNLNSNHIHFTKSDWKSQETFKELPDGARFGLAYIAFFGVVNIYMLRVNLSVAILSMTNSSYGADTHNHTGPDYCPATNTHTNSTGGEFNWDADEKGLILGAFFYGYVFTQLPGGYLASKYGGKWLFGGGILGTAILTLVTPIAARTSFKLLVAVRVAEGFVEGVTFPAMQAIWGEWAPPVERSQLVTITYAGISFGTVVAMFLSGVLCSSDIMGGWPSVFYIFGIVAIVWCLVWFVVASSSPAENRFISQQELQYIQDSIGHHNVKPPVPWIKIVTSKEVWAICFASIANNWGFFTLLTCLPLYLNDVLRYDLTEDALISALPYLVAWASGNITSVIADKLREKHVLNTTQTRKIFTSIGFLGSAASLVIAGYIGCNKTLAVTFICIANFFSSFGFPGFSANTIDIASRFAGILMGLSNMLGSIPGFVAPQVAGVLTEKQSGRTQWLYVFYIAAGVYVLGTVLFVLLASGVEQEWNKDSYFEVESDSKPLLDENNTIHTMQDDGKT